jgi:hypothetical protein
LPHLIVQLVQGGDGLLPYLNGSKQELTENGPNSAAAKDWRGGATDYLTV